MLTNPTELDLTQLNFLTANFQELPTALNMLLNSLNTSYSVIAGNQAQILLFMRSKSVVRNLEVGSCATHRLQLYRFVRLSRNQYYYPWEISKIIGRTVEGKEKAVKSMMSIGAIIIKEGMEQYEGKPFLQNNLIPVEVDLAFGWLHNLGCMILFYSW